MEINNREAALLCWVALIFIWAIFKKDLRKSIGDVVKDFCNEIMLTTLFIIAVYVAMVVALLAKIGLWSVENLKDTIIWTVAVAIFSFFQLDDMRKNERFFRKYLKELIAVSVAVEFVAVFYSFSLLVELILQPLLLLVGATLAYTTHRKDDSDKRVARVLEWALFTFFIVLVCHFLYNVYADYKSFFKVGTIVEFLLPIILSIAYIPCLFGVFVYVSYEGLYIQLTCFIKNKSLVQHAFWVAIKRFKFRHRLLKRWQRDIALMSIGTKDAIHHSIRLFFNAIEREKNPPVVPFEMGWSPYAAKVYLVEQDLVTGDYHNDGYDGWYACTPMKPIGEGLLPNNLAYYVDGNITVAKQLKLKLNVNIREAAESAHQALLHNAKELYRRAVSEDMPVEFEQAILAGEDHQQTMGRRVIQFKRNEWPEHRSGGYDLTFCICHT